MLRVGNLHYELADKASGTACGGIAAIHRFAQKIGLPGRIDQNLDLFKIHQPFHESDHVLNFAYNALCGGTCLQDMELRRNDESFLNALGTDRIPDPTTAGDFCRRFKVSDIDALQDAVDEVRLDVWKSQGAEFFEEATIEMDGTIVETTGQCKAGMDVSYKGIWGYHPLVLTLAETGEVLRIKNRSGNRPSHEGAAAETDRAIALCRRAGFRKITLRGDTAFTQTTQLDRWDDDEIEFIFGISKMNHLKALADDIPNENWKVLERLSRYERRGPARARPENVKETVVERRGYANIRLEGELVSEIRYRPEACDRDYRLVIICKNLRRNDKQGRFFDDYEYFFYLTNKWGIPVEKVVYGSNDRCNQENILAQLNQARALHAPVDTLESNWAYMVMAAQAWNLKAWIGLSIPVSGRWRDRHQAERTVVVRMEFKKFVEHFVRLPCQVVQGGRRILIRLLSWNEHLDIFNRWLGMALE